MRMSKMWILNLALIAVSCILLAIDKRIDSQVLLGSKVDEGRFEGRELKEIFDGQPVVPDEIVIDPLNDAVLLIYHADGSFWHKYPTVGILTKGERITFCKVYDREG